jgi:hypothetical protein
VESHSFASDLPAQATTDHTLPPFAWPIGPYIQVLDVPMTSTCARFVSLLYILIYDACMCVCVCVCVFVCVSVYVTIHGNIYIYMCIYMYVYSDIYIFVK